MTLIPLVKTPRIFFQWNLHLSLKTFHHKFFNEFSCRHIQLIFFRWMCLWLRMQASNLGSNSTMPSCFTLNGYFLVIKRLFSALQTMLVEIQSGLPMLIRSGPTWNWNLQTLAGSELMTSWPANASSGMSSSHLWSTPSPRATQTNSSLLVCK